MGRRGGSLRWQPNCLHCAVQKKGVKGTVTGVTITPITAPQPVAQVPATPTAPIPGATTGGGTPHTA